MGDHAKEVSLGKRFEFGKNWGRFLSALNEDCILEAEKSLRQMLGVANLSGKRFLDIGSGSGLFSLAARRLGASVHSFDYDPQSVVCTQRLKECYFPQEADWSVEEGSVLDMDYIRALGKFDIVYSWGVLHHTGAMWEALDYVTLPVVEGGTLYIAIYNDQSYVSDFWYWVKRFYCSGFVGRILTVGFFLPYFFLSCFALDLLRARNPIRRYTAYKKSRGMSMWTDWFDWLGGYPFEVAKPERIFDFYRERGYQLKRLKTCGGGLGCNEFVFVRQL